MRAIYCFLLACFIAQVGSAQTPNQQLMRSCKRFLGVKSFQCKAHIDFDIPTINIDSMSGKAYFKAPTKFKVKLKGIAFLPKENPFAIYQFLKDTTSYVAVANGSEVLQGVRCSIINVIPSVENDVVMSKIWVNPATDCFLKLEITSKTNGVIVIENSYSTLAKFCLPDQSKFTIDMNRFKMPKMVAIDINAKGKRNAGPKRTRGNVKIIFSGYQLNAVVDDSVFVDG